MLDAGKYLRLEIKLEKGDGERGKRGGREHYRMYVTVMYVYISQGSPLARSHAAACER